MSDAWGYDDDNQQHDNGPKALRDAYEAQKRMNQELQDSLKSIQNELRSQKLDSVFTSLGVPAAKELYQGEADPEKAKAWVESMRGVFGGGGSPTTGGNAPAPAAAPALSADQQAQYRQMAEAGSQGQPLGGMDAAAYALGNANDIQGIIEAMKRANGA